MLPLPLDPDGRAILLAGLADQIKSLDSTIPSLLTMTSLSNLHSRHKPHNLVRIDYNGSCWY